jgi:alpha-L-fucosidase
VLSCRSDAEGQTSDAAASLTAGPGDYVGLSGLRTRLKSAHMVKSGAAVKFSRDGFQTRPIGLPEKAPDSPVTIIAIACDSEPAR